jgi:hypothetical protein
MDITKSCDDERDGSPPFKGASIQTSDLRQALLDFGPLI